MSMYDFTHRIEQANEYDYPDDDAPLATPYDMESIQLGALRAVIHNRDRVILAQEAMIVALQVENERLRESIGALEVEDIEPETTPCPGCGAQVDFGDVCGDCEAKAYGDYADYLDAKEEMNEAGQVIFDKLPLPVHCYG